VPLVFAYGSNLNREQMKRRCPTAVKVGPLYLPNGRLIFRSVADVVIDPDGKIPGGVWRISSADERALDIFEGVGRSYRKKNIKLSIKGGQSERCVVYQMLARDGIAPPSQDYFDTILQGYKFFGLDKRYLYEALSESWADKNITYDIRRRRYNKNHPPLKRVA
jgi:gamma-glutamylcyclotransferase (GGCT)/AIG2-like uncharacterized protein YtfP